MRGPGTITSVVLAGGLVAGLVACDEPPPATPPVDAEVDAPPPPRSPALVVTPPPGVFAAAPTVTFSLDDPDHRAPDLTVWYTLDGSAPVIGTSPRVAPGTPITLDRSRLVRAFVADAAGALRWVSTGAYLVADPADAATAAFSSNLPVLVLWGESAVPDLRSDVFVPSSLMVFEPGQDGRMRWPGPATSSVRAGIHIRGSSTANYPKHPWHVETRSGLGDGDQPVALLGMPADSDWALGAPLDFDRALMRTSLVYALSNAIERWAPRTVHAEVFIAGAGETLGADDYVGVYEVTELIKRADQRVDLAGLDDDDVTPPAVTGGYIFKEDRLGPGDTGFRGGTGDGTLYFLSSFVLVEPSEADAAAAQKAYVKDLVDEVGVALTSPGFTTPAGVHYRDLVDVDGFIDHHILNMYSKNPDAFRLSGYYHKDRGGPLVAGPVWDFDRTMGCATDTRPENPTGWDPATGTRMFEHGFYGGLFRDPAFSAAYFARLGQLLHGPLSTRAIHARLDVWEARLTEAAARNFARWRNYPPRGSFHDEVERLKDWTARRNAWITGCLALPNPRTCTGT